MNNEDEDYGSYSIEAYGHGFIVADYSGNRGRFGAAYAGQSMDWHDQPIVDEPFASKEDAETFVKSLKKE